MNSKLPVIVGHRGAASLEPENTLISFQRAVKDGADAIELDVHLSKDGEVVVHHDFVLDRTAVRGRTTGAIKDLTYDELQEVGLAFGQRIMKLSEVFEKIKVPVYVEIKAPEATGPTLKLIRHLGVAQRVTLISFHPEAIKEIRATEPGWPCALIQSFPTDEAKALFDASRAPWASYGVYELTEADVKREHEAGRKVNVWTVSTLDQVRRLLAWGVDSISSDNPGWLKWAIEKLALDIDEESTETGQIEALQEDFKKYEAQKQSEHKTKHGKADK